MSRYFAKLLSSTTSKLFLAPSLTDAVQWANQHCEDKHAGYEHALVGPIRAIRLGLTALKALAKHTEERIRQLRVLTRHGGDRASSLELNRLRVRMTLLLIARVEARNLFAPPPAVFRNGCYRQHVREIVVRDGYARMTHSVRGVLRISQKAHHVIGRDILAILSGRGPTPDIDFYYNSAVGVILETDSRFSPQHQHVVPSAGKGAVH